ncbi:hypothetical protein GX48_03185 [Paracoccidioides brasiliensis]|nr:hypothetical protein GX48_03185 [Paracoccidioides brasiliensis]
MATHAARQVANLKQVHIKMVPSPRTLVESQLVLGAMRKFGEVSYFLNLKNTPSPRAMNTGRSALVIFETVDARNAAVEASPLIIPIPSLSKLLPESSMLNSGKESYPTKSTLAKPRIKARTREARRNRERAKKKRQNLADYDGDDSSPAPSILCYVEPSHHDHNVAVMQNPYYNAFHIATNLLEVQDLMKTATNCSEGVGYSEEPTKSLGDLVLKPPPWLQHMDCFPKKKRMFPFRHQGNVLRIAETLCGDSLMRMYREGREVMEKLKVKKAMTSNKKANEMAQEKEQGQGQRIEQEQEQERESRELEKSVG